MVMTRRKAFQTDRELDITRADNVLYLEICELGIEAELLDDSGVFSRRQARILELSVDIKHWTPDGLTVLRFGASDYHLARSED